MKNLKTFDEFVNENLVSEAQRPPVNNVDLSKQFALVWEQEIGDETMATYLNYVLIDSLFNNETNNRANCLLVETNSDKGKLERKIVRMPKLSGGIYRVIELTPELIKQSKELNVLHKELSNIIMSIQGEINKNKNLYNKSVDPKMAIKIFRHYVYKLYTSVISTFGYRSNNVEKDIEKFVTDTYNELVNKTPNTLNDEGEDLLNGYLTDIENFAKSIKKIQKM